MSVTEGAKVLGVSHQALSNLVNGRVRALSEMAICLAKASTQRRRPGYAFRRLTTSPGRRIR
ncbi:MAG: hypothetical protein OXG62_11405 [Nitrospinae bacterium]|nr:hypothetical protein [Nitrospinota bacterium]